jgi:hypothetical protein
MTVQLSEYFLFEKGGTESLPKVFLHGNCEQFFSFCPLTKKEMRSGTHFTKRNVFLPGVSNFAYSIFHSMWEFFKLSVLTCVNSSTNIHGVHGEVKNTNLYGTVS